MFVRSNVRQQFSVSDIRTDQTVVNDATADKVVATFALPTNFQSGDIIHWTAGGDLLNNSGSAVTYAPRLKLGSTTLGVSSALSIGAGASRHRWWAQADILVVAPASSQIAMGFMCIGAGSANGWTVATPSGDGPLSGTAAEDLTSAKNLVLSITLGTANALADFVMHLSTLEISRR